MSLRDEMAADIAGEIVPALDDAAKIDGVEKRCFVSTTSREVIISRDGNPADVRVSVLIVNADFTVLPVSGSKIVYPNTAAGREYKVGRIRDLHGVATWLDCIDWKSK